MMTAGLLLHERAALLGLSCREWIALAQSDRRIANHCTLATPGAVARLRRWLDAGRPAMDAGALRFHGNDRVREIVISTAAALPAPVRWHAVRFVTWIEVGRGAAGWLSEMPPRPTVPGDQPHLIALAGDRADDVLPGFAAHELAHSWHRGIAPEPLSPEALNRTEREHDRRLLAVIPAEDVFRHRYRAEALADQTAQAWGFPVHGNTHDPNMASAMRAYLSELEQETPEP